MDGLPVAIRDALREIAGHPAVRGEITSRVGESGRVLAQFHVEVELPSRAQADVSHTGVRRLEPVWLVFPPDFPLRAPTPGLRPDFPSNQPHVNPHRTGNLVPPCIFEGDLTELMHTLGLEKVLDQLTDWLRKAAAGQLMDLEQGWEPTRRGDPDTSFEFDADALARALPQDGTILHRHGDFFQVSGGTHVVLRDAAPGPEFEQAPHPQQASVLRGVVRVLVAVAPWDAGRPRVFDTYAADTVVDVPSLLKRAGQLGIAPDRLEGELSSILLRASIVAGGGWPWPGDFFVGVVLAAHRPVHLIGSHRTLEFIPYLVRVPKQKLRPELRDAVVVAAYQLHVLNAQLLAATSGHPKADLSQMLTSIGCGSVGSKIAVHLGRAGFGRQHLVDSESVSPHNMARHALLDGAGLNKAQQTKRALVEALAHANASALAADAVALLLAEDPAACAALIPAGTRLVIDTTASLRVGAAMCASRHLRRPELRVAQAFLVGGGRVAALLLEGPERCVRLDDLTAQMYEGCRTDVALRQALGGEGGDFSQVFIGDSCRSVTLTMPDSVVSRDAALIATQVQRWLVDGFPQQGAIALGVAGPDGIGMDWRVRHVAASHVLASAGDGGWTVRVSDAVVQTLSAEAAAWGELETGGALLGHVDAFARTIHVAGTVPAPADSTRSRTRFVLGTQGLQDALRQGNAESVGYLHYIGTWHTHPMGGAHSPMDRDTLGRLASFAPGVPMVSLVWTPQGLMCEVDRFAVQTVAEK